LRPLSGNVLKPPGAKQKNSETSAFSVSAVNSYVRFAVFRTHQKRQQNHGRLRVGLSQEPGGGPERVCHLFEHGGEYVLGAIGELEESK